MWGFLFCFTCVAFGVLETPANPRGLAGPFTHETSSNFDLPRFIEQGKLAVVSRVFPPDCMGDNYDVLADGLWCVKCKYYAVPTCNDNRYSYCAPFSGASTFCSDYYDYSDSSVYGVCVGGQNSSIDLSSYTAAAYDAYLAEAQELYHQCRAGLGAVFYYSNGKCCGHVREAMSPSAWCPTPCSGTDFTNFKKKSVKYGTQLCKKCCNDCFTREFCEENTGKTGVLAGTVFKDDNVECCDSMCNNASKDKASASSLASFLFSYQ